MASNGVSVVIPTIGRPSLLAAVRSVIEQDFDILEILVVSDGFDVAPRVAEILAPIDSPLLKMLAIPHSGGASSPRNRGILESSGDLIAFLDDDDEWLPFKISQQVSHFREGVVLVASNAIIGAVESPQRYFENVANHPRIGDLCLANPIVTSSVLCRKAALLEGGLFPNRKYEDYCVWLRMRLVGKFFIEGTPNVRYAKGSEKSLSSSWEASLRQSGRWSSPNIEVARFVLWSLLKRLQLRHASVLAFSLGSAYISRVPKGRFSRRTCRS